VIFNNSVAARTIPALRIRENWLIEYCPLVHLIWYLPASCSCIPHSLSVHTGLFNRDCPHRPGTSRLTPYPLFFSFPKLNSGCRPPACWYHSLDCNPISTNFDWFSHKYITNAYHITYTSSIVSHRDTYITLPSKRLSQHKRNFFLSNEPITLAPPILAVVPRNPWAATIFTYIESLYHQLQ